MSQLWGPNRKTNHKKVKDSDGIEANDLNETEAITEGICIDCGYTGYPVLITPGTFLMELGLWLFFLIPGLIYSIWRLSAQYDGCPECKGKMIWLDSPREKNYIKN